MRIWANTKTLDGHIDDLEIIDDKEKAEILLLGGKSIDLSDFPATKGIFRAGVGDNNVPYTEAAGRGISVRLPSDAAKGHVHEETANFTCQMIFHMMYRPWVTGNIHDWSKKPRRFLGDTRLLIVGAGKIGSLVQSKMTNFMHVDTYDVTEDPSDVLEEKFRLADCVSLHIPLTPTTHNFIDAEKLGWMKDGAILINTARGPIVNEGALEAEISSARLTAAFDVYWEEPYRGKMLKYHPNLFYMTPHVASTCDKFLIETAKDFKAFIAELSL
jgi:phosphoglycerate dehydrogenase-like enzyme